MANVGSSPPPRDASPEGARGAKEVERHGARLTGGLSWELHEVDGLSVDDSSPPFVARESDGGPGSFVSDGGFPEDDSTDTLDASDILEEIEDTET